MKKSSDVNKLKEICIEIEKEGQITGIHLTRLSAAFGPRFAKAWDAIKERRIKKYVFKPSGRIVWIVVGKEREYLVMPAAEFCSCEDFYFQFDKGHFCYHIIAQKLAEASGRFDLIEEEDYFYEVLIKEWKTVEIKVSKKHQREEATT
ncbi:hypothetical protein DRO69_01080 [Candidatus Bathyarchaeota archaeon]|nr:MAG: hypothetical protein DRO69_01080 [Candidatus Bathyarchaeota archaeon]